MVGNIPQWVSDWYDENYYASCPAINPRGPAMPPQTKDQFHVVRGDLYGVFGTTCGQREPWSVEVESLFGVRVVMDAK